MASRYAFATLLTSDAYLPGALALVSALRDLHPSPASPPEVDFQTVCVVTPETVDVSTIKVLRKAFDVVVGVEVLTQRDDKNLRLLGRPDLNTVLTKLHVFRLTQYSKVIFLDADILPIRPLSYLFALPHEFSAVPDVGWPDIFNSGVLVLTPGEEKFSELNELLNSKGTWDGGDQGLLNEWRGPNWNRLSFTYNTTPTAAYTYAPAYERFGSLISAIHFIGPNKPWSNIGFRAPFVNQQGPDVSQRAYDYDSLVDRWFAVYDKHYRASPISAPSHFEVTHYPSVWNEPAQPIPEAVVSGGQNDAPSTSSGISLSLDQLKQMAIEGMSASGYQEGQGEYRSMPLEGRVDLMSRPDEPVATPESRPSQSLRPPDFPSTPGPQETPPSPRLRPISLPSTPSFNAADASNQASGYFAQPLPQAYPEHGQQEHHQPQQEHYLQPPPSHVTPPRPPSPPMLVWNPAVEPPPNTAPTPNAFPSDTYFPNIWDQPPSRQHDQTHQQETGSPTSHTGAFFQPPPTPQIPEHLRRQGHYSNVIGQSDARTFSPDRTKVKTVFPWEDKPRHLPARKFPDFDSPRPETYQSPEPVVKLVALSSPPVWEEPKRVISPTRGLPASLSFANAWDAVPEIQRYASKLVRPPAPQPPSLGSAFDDEGWHRRSRSSKSWVDRAEASSMDGDDEDEGEEEDPEVARKRWADDSEGETVPARSRRGSGSISSSYSYKEKKKEYRVRGVQTISPVMRSQGVQVTIETTKVSSPSKDDKPRKPPSARSGAGRKLLSPSTAPGTLPSIASSVLNRAGSPGTTSPGARPSSNFNELPSPPDGMRSPREFVFDDAPPTSRPVVAPTLKRKETPPTPTLVKSRQQQASPPGSSLGSPPSSVGPISPSDSQPFASQSVASAPPPPKPSRVFDPARGVELFKQGSEQVLARFLKMSSWEEDRAR